MDGALPLAVRIATREAAPCLAAGLFRIELAVDFLEMLDADARFDFLRVFTRQIEELKRHVTHRFFSTGARTESGDKLSALRISIMILVCDRARVPDFQRLEECGAAERPNWPPD